MTDACLANDELLAAGNASGRDVLFRETPLERAERVTLGTAWALQPKRIGGLAALARLWLTDLVTMRRDLPDPQRAFNAGGLCGIARDVSPSTVIEAYRRGLFTFAHYGPLKWVSPPERCLLYFHDFHVEKELRRIMRQGRYRVTFDRDFERVIASCAGRRAGRWHVTWITPRIMRLFADLFDQGHAHSVEVWNKDGRLVGGSYGLAIGGAFFGESQFSTERNTSKIAMTVLTWHLARWGFAFSDAKSDNPTLRAMKFQPVPRSEFLALLADATSRPGKTGRWEVEADLKTVAAWDPKRDYAPPPELEPAETA